jgi:hypothetical protein
MSQETFEIYQVKDGDETRDFRFETLERLKAAGRSVERGNYEQVCAGTFERGNTTATETLNALFEQFNLSLPQSYTGRSMSVSDIVILRNEESVAAYYVDHFGFEEIPEFLTDTQDRATEQAVYKYYSTQRPVDIGTFPKGENSPVQIVNFDKREAVENGLFQAWGYLEYAAPLTEKQIDDYELKAAPDNPDEQEKDRTAADTPPTYYPISEETARRAKNANSFSDYVPGSATAEYRAMVDAARELGEAQKKSVDPMYHGKIDALIDRYARKLADNFNDRNSIDARVPSIMISGGGNFPVRQKEKQNMARDRNMGEYAEIKGILDKVRGVGTGGISADDTRAAEKLQAKLDGLQEAQEAMKAANAYYRKHKTLDGCPDLTEDVINKLKASMSRDWRKDPVPFPSYQLTNNNANIHRIEQRIEELKSKSEYAGWTFEGGRAEANEAENRFQLFFDEKPTDEQRNALKKNGFKWAPSQGAWQRQLTKNAIHAAGYINFIKPTEGKTPYQLQPFAHKTEHNR